MHKPWGEIALDPQAAQRNTAYLSVTKISEKNKKAVNMIGWTKEVSTVYLAGDDVRSVSVAVCRTQAGVGSDSHMSCKWCQSA